MQIYKLYIQRTESTSCQSLLKIEIIKIKKVVVVELHKNTKRLRYGRNPDCSVPFDPNF